MAYVALGALVGFVGFVLAVPFVGPWRLRRNLLLAAQTPDPTLGMGGCWRGLRMCEVVITSLTVHGDTVDVFLAEGPRAHMLRTHSAPAGFVHQLKCWYATQVALVLIVDDNAHVHLSGPEQTLSGFQELYEHV